MAALCVAQTAAALATGDIAFVQINTDAPDNFAFVALADIAPGTEIHFTDEGWQGAASGFRNAEDTGTWTAPSGGIAAGSVVRVQGSVVTGGGSWSGDALDTLTDNGDQVIAYQGDPAAPLFLAAIGAGTGSGDAPDGGWVDPPAGLDNQHSYLPAGLVSGLSANGLLSDNGAYTGPMTNTASGLARYINDGDTGWNTHSEDARFFAGAFLVNEALSPGDLAFVQVDADGSPDSFGFVVLADLDPFQKVVLTDKSWTNNPNGSGWGGGEGAGTWTAPAGGAAASSVVVIAGTAVGSGVGAWDGPAFTLPDDGDQLFAYQGHPDEPNFLAAIGFAVSDGTAAVDIDGGWLTNDNPTANYSYLPDALTLGRDAIGFSQNAGAYTGLVADTQIGLMYAVNDDGNWDLGAGPKAFSGAFSVLDALEPGDIAFVAFNTGNPDSFAFAVLAEVPGGSRIAFTDEGWTGSGWRGSTEDTGVWIAPAGGITAGTVVSVQGGAVTGGGSWSGEEVTGLASGDHLLAYQGAEAEPRFLAGVASRNWDPDLPVDTTTESLLPGTLELGVHALQFGSTADNGSYDAGKTNGSRWGLLTAINNEAGWTASGSRIDPPPARSFSVSDGTPPLAAGDIAFVAYSTDTNAFAFVALANLSAGTEIAFTDIPYDGTNLVNDPAYLGEHVIVWTVPGSGICAGQVVRIARDGAVSGGGTASGGLGELSVAGDQILAFQNYLTEPAFIAGVSSRNWRGSGSVLGDLGSSYLPSALTGGDTAVSGNSTDVDNGIYTGATTAVGADALRALINAAGFANWTRDNDDQTWPASWNFTILPPGAPRGTLIRIR